jgi:hypothetical protein
MKNIYILLLLFTNIIIGQIHLQNEDKYSIQLTTDNVIFQKDIFYAGIEFNAEFSNGLYVRPQIHYAALKDGYLEISAGLGINFTYEKTTEYNWKVTQYILNHLNGTNFYSGIKLGVINRSATNGIFGYEAGVAFYITEKISLGLRGSYDFRGDAKFYDGEEWVYNSQGYIKLIL